MWSQQTVEELYQRARRDVVNVPVLWETGEETGLYVSRDERGWYYVHDGSEGGTVTGDTTVEEIREIARKCWPDSVPA